MTVIKWFSTKRIVGGVGQVWKVVFTGCFKNAGIPSCRVVNPVISCSSFEPFVRMRPFGSLTDYSNNFIVKVKMIGEITGLYFAIDSGPNRVAGF